MDELSRDIRYLKGVGERRAELFSKLGVTTVGALLRYYPRGYIDMRAAFSVAGAPVGERAAVRATVIKKSLPVRISGGRTMFRVLASDGDADLMLVWFNNKFAPAALKEGEEHVFFGRIAGTLVSKEIVNPLVVKEEEGEALTPQYPLTAGLSSRYIASTVRAALALGDELPETLPGELREKYNLIEINTATRDIHFPDTLEDAARAKQRLIFEELLTLSLGLSLIRAREKRRTAAKLKDDGLEAFIDGLPFELTSAQARSIAEIAADIKRDIPMNRLLQGDVGSGKTVCAAAAILCAAKSGWQSAVMAPTEILANQHAITFEKLLAPYGLTVGLLTSAVKGKARATLLEQIALGGVDLVIGTHAVIGEGVEFARLGLVVADEQHRFGVNQRGALAKKGERPHLLVMSATPIPRTLALIIYGDLDLSIIDELPPGRKPVKTRLVSGELRARYLNFVRETVKKGNQAYIVCPLVEDGEEPSDMLSATAYHEELCKNYLAGLTVGLLHGRMKPKDKEEVMRKFARGETQVLVATTVIEVGVDVPNATLMIIENAERFGLAALHQLRGRVGRGAHESWCILVSNTKSETARARLEIMTRTNDGFEIAREDLKTRGPGDFFGSRQHGLPELSVADLASDENVLHSALAAANGLLAKDPKLTHPEHVALRGEVARMFAKSETTLN